MVPPSSIFASRTAVLGASRLRAAEPPQIGGFAASWRADTRLSPNPGPKSGAAKTRSHTQWKPAQEGGLVRVLGASTDLLGLSTETRTRTEHERTFRCSG